MEERKAKQIKVAFDYENEAFVLYKKYWEDDDWKAVKTETCVQKKGDKKDAEPMYMSVAFLEEIRDFIFLGWKMVR